MLFRRFRGRRLTKRLLRDEAERVEPAVQEAHLRMQVVVAASRRELAAFTAGRPICPNCGGRMVVRMAKRGIQNGSQFWGCFELPRLSDHFRPRSLSGVCARTPVKEEDLPPEARAQIARVRLLGQTADRTVREFEARVAALREVAGQERSRIAADREMMETFVADKVAGSELIARAWADYEEARTEALVEKLRLKGRPARAAAEELREKGRSLAEVRRRAKLAEWVVALYEWHFPWLADLRDEEEERTYSAVVGRRRITATPTRIRSLTV